MPQVDYDALAKQHGGAVNVDYDALAKQHGGAAATPPPAPPDHSPVAKTIKAAWEGLGGPMLGDLLDAVGSGDPAKFVKAGQTIAAFGDTLRAEPGRIWSHLTKSGEGLLQGDRQKAVNEAIFATPMVGGPIEQITTEAATGKPAEALGHTVALFAPMAAGPVTEAVAPKVSAATAPIRETLRELPAARAEVALRNKIVGRPQPAPNAITPEAIAGGVIGYKTGGVLPAGAGAAIGKRVGGAVRGAIADEAEALNLARSRAAAKLSGAADLPDPGVIATEAPPAVPVTRPAPVWQQTPPAADVPMPSAPPDVSAQIQAAADEMRARAAARQAPPAEPAQAPGPTGGEAIAQEIGADWSKLSRADKARLEQVAQARENVAAQPAAAVPTPPPQPSPSPTPPAVEPPPAAPAPLDRAARAQQIAADLENSMRVDRLTDYLKANKIPPAMVAQFGPDEWRLVAGSANTGEPSAAQVAEIRANYAAPAAIETPSNAPAEAAQQFETARTARTRRKAAAKTARAVEPAEPITLKPGQTPAEALAEMMPESVRQLPAAGPAAPTASETRVQGLAQHLADSSIPLEDLATLPDNPAALDQLTRLGRALEIDGAPTKGEIPQIIEAVRKLREGKQPPPAAAVVELPAELARKPVAEARAAVERAQKARRRRTPVER